VPNELRGQQARNAGLGLRAMTSGTPGRQCLVALFAASGALACAKPTALGADVGVAEAVAQLFTAVVSLTEAPPSAPSAVAEAEPAPPHVATEASRLGELSIAALSGDAHAALLRAAPELRQQAALIRDHFGEGSAAIAVQRADLSAGAHAVLLAHEPSDRALVLVTDARGDLLWRKDRPLVGVISGARHLTLVAGGAGHVLVVFHAAPWLAVRAWLADGSILADHQLLEVPAASGVAAMHWPGVGLLAVVSSRGGPRAQLLTEEGKLLWGPNGAPVGIPWDAPPPLSLAVQAGGWLLGQHGKTAAGADRWLVFGYDRDASRRWPQPIDLGPSAAPMDRLILRPDGEERVVAGPFSGPSAPARRVWLTADGRIEPHPPAPRATGPR